MLALLAATSAYIQCDECKVWQHCECMRVNENIRLDVYFCEKCLPSAHTELLEERRKLVREKGVESSESKPIGSRAFGQWR